MSAGCSLEASWEILGSRRLRTHNLLGALRGGFAGYDGNMRMEPLASS